MRSQFGVDLGGANLYVSGAGEGILLHEPSVVAIARDSGQVLAVGEAAEKQLNRRSAGVALSRPFSGGLLEPPHVAEAVLSACLNAAGHRPGMATELLLSIPCDTTDVQQQMLVEMAERAGVRTCRLVYSPLAALCGAYPDLPPAALVVDIGAVRTSIMLICRGRIYYMKTVAAGGQSFDRAIADYVMRKRKIRISLRAAEQIKYKIGTVWSSRLPVTVEVTGHDANGRGVLLRMSSDEMYEALEAPMGAIMQEIWVAVSKTPSECVESVFSLGIQLTGGGSCLDGMDSMISAVIGVAARKMPRPLEGNAYGLSELYAILPTDIPSDVRNLSDWIIKRVYAGK